jgi:hypothetical protein
VCSVLLLRHHEVRKHPTAAPCLMKPELGTETPVAQETAAKLRGFKLAVLLALSALVFFVGGAMAQAQKISPPILTSGPCDVTLARIQPIDKVGHPPPGESHFGAPTLPPIEAIGTDSSIRPFLASGVPPDLTRAALRCAWSTDLTIREFIGLSESSWDFNAPGVPGFGSLTADDARRLLARMMEGTKSSDPERLAGERLVSK